MNVETLLGKVVTGFRTEEGGDIPQEEICDVTDSEYYVLITADGECSIELRCDHNGYYGGWLNTPYEVKGWKPVEGDHREITKDSPFRAH